jgi:hypothetical protein
MAIELSSVSPELTFRQRWNHYLVLLFSVIALLIGLNLRDSTLNATTLYTNAQAGVRASYPQNWLIDESGDYVFRVRDTTQIGFKTTIQVSVRPVGGATSARSLLDALTLNRSQILAAYKVLTVIDPFVLSSEQQGMGMSYTYADFESDPFLQSVPIVVRGLDVLTIKRGQAIIITFLSDAGRYDKNYPIFEQFLASLEF